MSNIIEKVLIANRGEIARRIQRACRKLNLASVTIASEVDAEALFAREADELVIVGPAASKDSYLNSDKIIAAALEHKCNAIHPGYGFLSENSAFAAKVIESGLIFVGPSPESIALLGNKTAAKDAVTKAGVPCAPSSPSGLDDAELLEAGDNIGFPLLIKAAAGGGGRGMRKIFTKQELKDNLPRARAEAQKFFSNPDIFLEKLIEGPRHVEVQVLGDMHGNIIHLGTRDCSTQRRHQKIIEEAPAPLLSLELRERIHDAAVKAAKSANYYNAGTVEFLVKGNEFFFLEVNTRIQVEHPVTEAVSGLDLVEMQLKIAGGAALGIKQEDVQLTGHAMEFRICAEDPLNNYAPGSGFITSLIHPQDPALRADFGFEQGDKISLFYDSMIGKVVILAPTRAQCIDKSLMILKNYVIEGVPTNVALHRALLYNGLFRRGPVDIGFLERDFDYTAIKQLAAYECRDPAWREPCEGAEVKNLYEYKSEKFKTTYTIEIRHKKDGFFLAVPCDSQGRRAKNQNCRMSNGLNTVIRSLIDDVLEQKPPAEIFV